MRNIKYKMCKQCETKPVYEFTNQRKLCKTCFVRWFQKKVLYSIRKFKMISKGDIVGYDNKGRFREVVLEDVLKIFGEKAIVELVKLPNRNRINKIAIASTTDLEADKIVHALIKGKGKLGSAKEGKIIKPLYLFLDKEILLYAKLRGLVFKEKKENKDEIGLFIEDLEKTHPEVKQAVVGSYLGSC